MSYWNPMGGKTHQTASSPHTDVLFLECASALSSCRVSLQTKPRRNFRNNLKSFSGVQVLYPNQLEK